MNEADLADVIPAEQSNGLAIAGFICSLIGLFAGGLLSPVGLILSIIAMGREPKGFAIAGLILGLVGTCGWIILFIVMGGALMAALLGVAAVAVVALNETERLELSGDSVMLGVKLAEAQDRGELPTTLDGLAINSSQLTDPWGNPYRYSLINDGADFRIFSDGPDGTEGTEDDIDLRDLKSLWEGDRPVEEETRIIPPSPPGPPSPPTP